MLLKILIYLEVFTKGSDEDKYDEFIEATSTIIIMSICIDTLSIFMMFYLIYCEAKALEEEFPNYCLLRLRGKHRWIPFNHLIQKQILERVKIDYSEIKCFMPGITNKLGIYLP